MTKKQEEIIKEIKIYIHDYTMESFDDDGYTRYEISEEEQEFFNNIETALNMLKEKDTEIEKKDRQIDLMAEQLAGLTIWNNEKEEPLILADKEEVIKYFEKKRQITVKSDKIVVERKD